MSAADGGPNAIAGLTALLHNDYDTARDIVLSLDEGERMVAFCSLVGTIAGLSNALAVETGADGTALRDALLHNLGTALAERIDS